MVVILLFALIAMTAPARAVTMVEVGRYHTHELVFTAATSPANPFDTYLLNIEVTDPSGKKFTIDGFYDGDGKGGQNGTIWKARVSPYMTGIWSWRTVPGDVPDTGLSGLKGQFNCVESGDLGGVVSNGQSFRFQGGDYVYLLGNFLDRSVRPTHLYMSEVISDAERDAIITRNRDFHASNKINLYFANVGDYNQVPVSPWLGDGQWNLALGQLARVFPEFVNRWHNDNTKMDLARWRLYDQYIRRFKDERMFATLWFFADDSGFGGLSQAEKNRLFRYAMARTSAFNHVLYVIALEWEEGWSSASVNESGHFIQAHNPWGRPLSVHSRGAGWAFSGQSWGTFIASQPGNGAQPHAVNRQTIVLQRREVIPHMVEEFGVLKRDNDATLRANLWASFMGGGAGSGTGSDLKAFQRFFSQARVPFQRMVPANKLVESGGFARFVRAEMGHHYAVYSSNGTFGLNVSGTGLLAQWFNPRDPDAHLGKPFRVAQGEQIFTSPTDTTSDWVLWITDGSNLSRGLTHPSPGATLTQEIITKPPRS